MASTAASSTPSVGFLTVVHYAQHGYFGGLLVLNQLGRPREFHCTMPVRPSRAQEILYGRTLRPYLCGEQIATALLAKLASPLAAVLTDDVDVLSVAQLTDTPVLLVPNDTDDEDSVQASVQWHSMGGRRFGSASPGIDFDALARLLTDFIANVDPAEPFERIRAAIDQAQRSAA